MISKATIVGRIAHIDNKFTANGNKMLVMRISTWRNQTVDGVKKEYSSIHHVTCFGKLAETLEPIVQVGHLAYCEGEINNRKTGEGAEAKWFYGVTGTYVKVFPKGYSLDKNDIPSSNVNAAEDAGSVGYGELGEIPF